MAKESEVGGTELDLHHICLKPAFYILIQDQYRNFKKEERLNK